MAQPLNQNLVKLMAICGQKRTVQLDSLVGDKMIARKLGEGSFSEVFLKSSGGVNNVLKIVPFGGDQQTTLDDILSEIRITKTVSDWGALQTSPCVVQAKKFTVATGCFPKHLINIWEKWKEEQCKESRHPHPGIYNSKQHYMVLEFEYGGEVLKNFHLKNQEEVLSVIKQVVFILAVMERDLGFEHRDLHLSNILLRRRTNHNRFKERRNQISVQLIDFSFARCNGQSEVLYKDLSTEGWLFEGTGHEQFTICRQMREILHDSWGCFNPKTNVIWVAYLFKMLLKQLRHTKKLRSILNNLKECKSCNEMWKML